MKKSIYQFLSVLLVIFLFGNTSIFAQSDNDEKMVKITIVTNDDQVIVKKKRIKTSELPTDFEEFRNLDSDDIKSIDVEIVENFSSKKECDPKKCKPTKDCQPDGNGGNLFYYRNGSATVEIEEEEMVEMRERMRSQRRNWNMSFGTDPKPLLGVYVSDDLVEKGVKLSSVVRGKGAEAAGLKGGDIITKINRKSVNSANDIGRAIKELKPGDAVKVSFLRDGRKMTEKIELSAGKSRFRNKVKRDPCKVFIGVYTNNLRGDGVRVQGIIDGTDAAEMDLQEGDVILELDNVTVNSQSDLLRERNQNEPGDYFKLEILRDGKRKTVKGQFQACDQEEEVESQNVPQIRQEFPGSLNVEALRTYPNPTFGNVNIEFEGAQVPTVVRIIDVTGKVVFEDEVQNFDGIYKRRVEVQNARPGNLSVTVIQNNQAVTKNVILLNRA